MTPQPIEIVPYNAGWPEIFESEALLIKQLLGDNCLALHHIGSTSIPGLAAKPIIDIIAEVKNPSSSVIPLGTVGYHYRGEYNIPFRFLFTKKEGVKVNLHVYEEGNSETDLNILFRDYLRDNPQARDKYASLKESLIRNPAAHEKNNSRFTGYTLGKDAFIRQIVQEAGFNKFRLMHCTHAYEWETARALRQRYFFDKIPIPDPYEWTFNDNGHVHFVLYKGTRIIGYAHLQLWEKARAALRIIVIDEPFQKQGFGHYLMGLCEKWLKLSHYKSLHIQSSRSVQLFYEKQGYKEMPFNDPQGEETHSQDIDMGKIL